MGQLKFHSFDFIVRGAPFLSHNGVLLLISARRGMARPSGFPQSQRSILDVTNRKFIPKRLTGRSNRVRLDQRSSLSGLSIVQLPSIHTGARTHKKLVCVRCDLGGPCSSHNRFLFTGQESDQNNDSEIVYASYIPNDGWQESDADPSNRKLRQRSTPLALTASGPTWNRETTSGA